MRAAAANLEFERAAALRDRLKRLRSPAWPRRRAERLMLRSRLEPLKKPVLEVQEYLPLLGQIGRGLVTPPIYVRDIIEQFDAIGLGSLTVVAAHRAVHRAWCSRCRSGLTLDQFGARPMVGRIVSASMVKELGPVLTALMVAGRVGSGIAAELGSMVVTDQIAALRALGTDPVRKLVIPRVLAGTLMLPVLTVVSDAVGIVGGAIISATQLNVAASVYWNNVVQGCTSRTSGWG